MSCPDARLLPMCRRAAVCALLLLAAATTCAARYASRRLAASFVCTRRPVLRAWQGLPAATASLTSGVLLRGNGDALLWRG